MAGEVIKVGPLGPYANNAYIIVDRKTMTMVEQLVHADPVGPFQLKGLAQPVPAFSIGGLKST